MRVGSLVFSTDQGLGILAKSFYDHHIVTDAIVVNHSHRENHYHWYPKSEVISGRSWSRESKVLRRFLEDLDAMLFFETPFYWELLPLCKELGIKTFLMPMYECMPSVLPHYPDRMICPSLLDLRYAQVSMLFGHVNSEFIPVPVEVPHRLRKRADVFVHNAGHGGLLGRNGTGELLDAMRLVKAPIKLILRSQKRLQWGVIDSRIDYRVGSFPHSELYLDGDVFIFPEKFNGLSLPLQEAHASGMMVMATDRFPMNIWLPSHPLIPVSRSQKNQISPRCLEFDEAVIEPRAIADMIDAWYGCSIEEYSGAGLLYAQKNSWEVLGPRYQEAIGRHL